MIKASIIFDKNKLSKKIKSYLIKNIKIFSIKKCNLIIVVGGDGFMLQTLKKYQKYNKPFYGMNTGTFGFFL